ncbi:cytochrome c oxidase assembly protein subunit 15 [Virgibacillus subterraneus]|uniref:Heme A synthase n=2 Tax=Virgibacillus TaxID=84406 RepID=A0A1H1CI93_9BACI|nr:MULTISPECIES: heme A synthase [Virgibacillus]SDQ63862.1 cytochrome c oxidase assembly protein subunit 15 [Virgibacillus salinus]SEQ62243.1 cytochrome c oxidase assembly protein subunit 15 [Virgibacillus subterraneus]
MIKMLKWLSVVSTLGMVFVLMGGSLVTKTESGMGCGATWPLCHGEFVPSTITPELVIELSHRLVSGIMGVTVLALSILAWKFIGHIREVKFLAFLSSFFLVLQALIGAAAVVWNQSDFVLATHFGISLISFASLFLLMLLIFEIDQKFDAKSLIIQKKHRIEIYALTIYTLLVVYTGALVRHANSSMACGDWPFCSNGSPFSLADYNFEQWVQMGHRLAASLLFIWTVVLFIKIMKNYRTNRVMYWGWITTVSLISLQVFFGAMIVFTMLNLGIALLHAFVISCYFAMLSYFILLSTRSAKH